MGPDKLGDEFPEMIPPVLAVLPTFAGDNFYHIALGQPDDQDFSIREQPLMMSPNFDTPFSLQYWSNITSLILSSSGPTPTFSGRHLWMAHQEAAPLSRGVPRGGEEPGGHVDPAGQRQAG